MGIAELCYALYKLDWERKISTDQKMDLLKDYFEELETDGAVPSEEYSFEEYLFERGYGGSLYVCFEEFLEAEYEDKEYISELLCNDYLYGLYEKDLFDRAQTEDMAKEAAGIR